MNIVQHEYERSDIDAIFSMLIDCFSGSLRQVAGRSQNKYIEQFELCAVAVIDIRW